MNASYNHIVNYMYFMNDLKNPFTIPYNSSTIYLHNAYEFKLACLTRRQKEIRNPKKCTI